MTHRGRSFALGHLLLTAVLVVVAVAASSCGVSPVPRGVASPRPDEQLREEPLPGCAQRAHCARSVRAPPAPPIDLPAGRIR